MGMAASQGRLLFMTARLSNNEFEQQCVAYSKQRLADDSQEANDKYLEALSATQYQVITGYNGDTPTYEPVTYNQLTGIGNVATGKQYIVSDNTGKIVVTKAIAEAFEEADGDYNKFLKTVNIKEKGSSGSALTQVAESDVTEQDIHNAWDKYFASIKTGDTKGIYYDTDLTSEHVLGITFHSGENTHTNPTTGEAGQSVAYCTYNAAYKLGSAKNKIYLQEDNSGNYFYNNYKVQTESYTDDYEKTKYRVYYVKSDDLNDKTDGNKSTNLMQDSDKIYLDYINYDDSSKKFTVYETDDDGNIQYNYISGSTSEYDYNNPKVKTTYTGNLYVDQDYGNETVPTFTQDDKITLVTADETPEKVLFYSGTTDEQRQLYDYAMAVSEKYASMYDPSAPKLTYDADKVQYYKNIYDQMTTKGYTTFEKMLKDKYINTMGSTENNATTDVNDEKGAFRNDEWLVNLVKKGKLSLSFYSSENKAFVATTLDDDESITEKENKSKMAIAEQIYNNHMDKIESEDKKYDMQLSKLDAEHTALQTEYESVAKVISKNVEKSFGTFNA